MTKVMLVFGTRPEAIKMAPVVKALQAAPDRFETVVCVTGQHREMLDQVLDLFGIVPDHDLAIMTVNQSLAEVTSNVLTQLDPLLEAERPDWVLVQGDTSTAMAASLAAFYRKIQVGHVEAGLRTHNKHHPFPEEINRRITGVVADLHFAPTAWAASNLRREGVAEDKIVVTGNTVIDAIKEVVARPFKPDGIFPPGFPPAGKRLILVTAHRRENFGEGISNICAALIQIAERDDVHIAYPVHPNPHIMGPVHEILGKVANITLLPPLAYRPLVWLMDQSYLILTDSGGIQEEAPGLGKPVLVLRETTERPEGIEAGMVLLVGSDPRTVSRTTCRLLDNGAAYQAMARTSNPYGSGNAALKIVSILGQVDPSKAS